MAFLRHRRILNVISALPFVGCDAHGPSPRLDFLSSLLTSHIHHIMSSWADDIDGEEQPQTFTDAKGITTHIEYTINDDGKKVKVRKTTTLAGIEPKDPPLRGLRNRTRAKQRSRKLDCTWGIHQNDASRMNSLTRGSCSCPCRSQSSLVLLTRLSDGTGRFYNRSLEMKRLSFDRHYRPPKIWKAPNLRSSGC